MVVTKSDLVWKQWSVHLTTYMHEQSYRTADNLISLTKKETNQCRGCLRCSACFLELRNVLSTFVLVGNVVRFVRIDEIPGTYSRDSVCPAGEEYIYDVRRMDS